MNPSTTTPSYRIIPVPRASSRLADLVAKSRSARLHALQTDPDSFVATHRVESALPLSVWKNRLTNPDTTVLACVSTCADDTDDDVQLLLEREWIALAAVRGPLHQAEYYATPAMGLVPPACPAAETRWHVYDVYTLPSHRGRGLAKRIVAACIRLALSLSRASPFSSAPQMEDDTDVITQHDADKNVTTHARIRLFTDPRTPWLVTMYTNLGFVAAGHVTLHEAVCANGLQESIPPDTRATRELDARWHTRRGLALERVVGLGDG